MKIQHCILVSVSFCAVCFTVDSLRVDYNNVDWVDVKNKAAWVGNLVLSNKEISRNAPSIVKFLKDVAVSSKELHVNPAYVVSSVYVTGMVVALYYYSLEAESQLRRAQFKQDDIKLIINTEISPYITFLDSILSSGDPDDLCKVKEDFRRQLEESAQSLKNIRGDIEKEIDNAFAGSSTSKAFMGFSGFGAVMAVGAIATAPCLGTALLACPQAIGGAASLVGSTGFFGGFWYNKLTHEETIEILNTTRLTVYKAEETCRMLRTTIGTNCMRYSLDKEMVDVNRMMNQIEVLKPKGKKMKLEHHRNIPSENED